jgi:hypothetical protein
MFGFFVAKKPKKTPHRCGGMWYPVILRQTA